MFVQSNAEFDDIRETIYREASPPEIIKTPTLAVESWRLETEEGILYYTIVNSSVSGQAEYLNLDGTVIRRRDGKVDVYPPYCLPQVFLPTSEEKGTTMNLAQDLYFWGIRQLHNGNAELKELTHIPELLDIRIEGDGWVARHVDCEQAQDEYVFRFVLENISASEMFSYKAWVITGNKVTYVENSETREQ